MDLVYFVVFVSVLVFVHEFGHFAAAKWAGVKVLELSIGFGPKLLKLRGRETTYALGVLPFGGYVRMLEELKVEGSILPEERARTFEAQPFLRRAVIILAGPAMNLALPVLLYATVYFDDKTFLAPLVGEVLAGHPADGVLEAGDRIVAVEGRPVVGFHDIQEALAPRAGRTTSLTIERAGATREVSLVPEEVVEPLEPRELDLSHRVGRIGIAPSFAAPVLGVRADGAAARSGLRTFDRVTAVDGRRIERFVDLSTALAKNKSSTVVISYLRPKRIDGAWGDLTSLAVMEPGVAAITPRRPAAGDATAARDAAADVADRYGIETSDLWVAAVPPRSSEAKMGLTVGDRIRSLDGVEVRSWRALEAAILREPTRTHELAWEREGVLRRGTFRVRTESFSDGYGQQYTRFVFRTASWLPRARPEEVANPHVALHALTKGLEETGRAMKTIAIGMLRIVQGRVGLGAVAGPITLYDIAGDAGARGSSYFVWAMAVMSVNLGLLNLLPIPILDGGQLTMATIEWVRRRPLAPRTRELLGFFGMVIVVALMLLAFKNDVVHRWDVISEHGRALVR